MDPSQDFTAFGEEYLNRLFDFAVRSGMTFDAWLNVAVAVVAAAALGYCAALVWHRKFPRRLVLLAMLTGSALAVALVAAGYLSLWRGYIAPPALGSEVFRRFMWAVVGFPTSAIVLLIVRSTRTPLDGNDETSIARLEEKVAQMQALLDSMERQQLREEGTRQDHL